jgi:hypothetical protein
MSNHLRKPCMIFAAALAATMQLGRGIMQPGTFFAGPDFLHSEYLMSPVHSSVLDEDPGTDQDEFYGKISFVDCHVGLTRTFRTGTFKGDFRA